MTNSAALSVLEGGEVDTVSFVRDYVEFRIEYHVLRALAPPLMRLADGRSFTFPLVGSRDALCQLIGDHIVSASETGAEPAPGWRIDLQTASGARLLIPFDHDTLEQAHLMLADPRGQPDQMIIW